MRKISAIFLFITMLTACDKAFINGDLDGMWKLQQVDCEDASHRPTDIYYSFQRHMMQISQTQEEGLPLSFLGNMEYYGNEITVYGFRKYLEEERVCTDEELRLFHLYSDRVTFTIDKLDGETLLMHSNAARYTLRKW